MLETNTVAEIAKVAEKIFIIMQFQTAFKVIGGYDNMIVEVVSVDMGCDNCLMIFELIKASDEFHSDIVGLLRRDGFTDLEGLNEVIKSHAAGFVS